MDFNLTYARPEGSDRRVDARWGDNIQPLQAEYNLTYLQIMDVIKVLWEKGSPEILFIPFSDNNIYDPDLGYVIYSLVSREPQQNNVKPRYQESFDSKTNAMVKLSAFTQGFINTVKFSAIHKDPRVAEEIIEAFEDVLLRYGPIFSRLGVQSFQYGRRAADESKTRYGDNLACRTLLYLFTTQKIFFTEISKLEEVYIQVQAPRRNLLTTDYEDATPSGVIHVNIYDNYATPITHST